MCLSRGDCDNLFDNHGDPRNITMATIQDAANVASLTVPEVLRNIQRGVSKGLSGMTDWTDDQSDGSSLDFSRRVTAREPQTRSAARRSCP